MFWAWGAERFWEGESEFAKGGGIAVIGLEYSMSRGRTVVGGVRKDGCC